MTIRQRLSDIALAISGGSPSGASGGWGEADVARYLTAIERLADCACGGSPSPSGASCYPFFAGGEEVNPIYWLGETNHAVDEPVYNSVAANIPHGNYRIVASPIAMSGEATGILISVTQADGQYASHTMAAVNYGGTAVYDFDVSTGASVVIASLGGGYPSYIQSLSLCPRASAISTPVVFVSGDNARSDWGSGGITPIPGRPFFGPFAWQPSPQIGLTDVAEVIATGIQDWAERWAELLDPTEEFIFQLREFSEAYTVLQQVDVTLSAAALLATNEIQFTLTSSLLPNSTFQVEIVPPLLITPEFGVFLGANRAAVTWRLVP